jgi:uncharacterized protein
MIVDVNWHWLPKNFFSDESLLNAFIRTIPRAYGEHVKVTTIPGSNLRQVVIARPKDHINLQISELHTDARHRIESMDEGKIDKAIMRLCIWEEWITLELARKINDSMAQDVREHPDRLQGLAVVPPWGDKESIYELERAIKELGLAGVEIPAHYGNLYLDAEEFRPFFKKINELGVPMCVHHTPLPVDYGHIYDYVNLRRIFGRSIDQLTSVGRILYSGMLDELPNLKFIHTFLAGGFFAFANIVVPKKSTVKEVMEERFDPAASEKVKGYLERNIFFDIAHAPPWGKLQLECAIKVLGADHVLFGTSYPLRREWLIKGVDSMMELEIGDKERSLVLGENAMKLFKLKA